MELGTLVLSLGSMVFSLSSASPFTFFNKEHIVDQVSPVVDQLWREVSNGKAFITTGDLSSFFIRYDDLEQPFLFLLETPFVRGEESWTRDFQSMQMTPELSKAYFRSLDVFRNVWLQILTNEDMFTIIEICEKHADIQGSGHISEKQFKNGMKEVVLRSIPFSLLFTRFMVPIREDFTMYDRLHWPHFLEIFNDIDSNGDGEVRRGELADYWSDGGYGPKSVGRDLFDVLDHNESGSLTENNWQQLFDDLNCRDDGESYLDFEEYLQLDLISHGLREYPGGDCKLDRI